MRTSLGAWYSRTIEKHRWLIPISLGVFFLASTVIVYWPIATGVGVFSLGWTLNLNYPLMALMERSIKLYHEFPLWTPYGLSGFPFFAGQGWGMLSPFLLGFVVLTDYLTAYHLATIAVVALTLGATYALARHFMLSRYASIVAAFTYTFGQYIIIWSEENPWPHAFLFSPLLLLIVAKLHGKETTTRSRFALYVVLGGCSIAFGLYSGVFDVVLFTVFAGFLFSLYLDLCNSPPSDTVESARSFFHPLRWKTLLGFSLMACIGVLVSLPLILPTLPLIDVSWREIPFSFARAIGGAGGINLPDLPRFLYPHFYAGLPYLPGRYPYVGTLSLFLGIWGLMRWRTKPEYRVLFLLFITMFIAQLPHSPIYRLLQPIPPFNRLNGNWKLLSILFLNFSLFAGIGFDALADISRRSFHILLKLWTVACSLFFVGVVFWNIIWHTRLWYVFEQFFIRQYILYRQGTKPIEHYEQVLRYFAGKVGESLSFSNHLLLISLFFCLAATIIFWLWHSGRIPQVSLFRATLVFVVLNFFLIWQDENRFFPKRILDLPPTFAAIQKENPVEPFRINMAISSASLLEDPQIPTYRENIDRYELAFALGLRAGGGLHGFENAEGDDPLSNRRNDRILSLLGASYDHVGGPGFDDVDDVGKAAYITKRINIYSALNVRYLITLFTLGEPWKKIAEVPVAGIVLSVYENPLVLPRAYFAKNVRVLDAANEEENFKHFADNGDFHTRTLIECPKAACQAQEPTKEPDTARVEILEKTFTRTRMRTSASIGRWLVFSEQNLPFWEATIDGKPAHIEIANYTFKGVFVPAGEHVVEFTFPGIFAQTKYSIYYVLNKRLGWSKPLPQTF